MPDGTAASGSNPPTRSRLLVVDDEMVQRLLVCRVAQRHGLEADQAASLAEATLRLAQHRYDIIVLDLSLQDRDGIELLRGIAEQRFDPVMIFISGFDNRVRQSAARLAEATGLRVAGTLGKPLALDQLASLLHSLPDRPTGPKSGDPTLIGPGDLRRALDRRELLCLYQPKLRLRDRRITGFEVLTRWHSPRFGLVSPELFVPLAERSGLIDRLTHDVLTQSLLTFEPWRRRHPELTLAVNLSPLSLTELTLPDLVANALAVSGTPPSALVMEVTEGSVMAEYVAAANILTRLRIQGVGVSIDDFGTGHSSLLSLLRLPFNEIKIDQSFVRQLTGNPEATKIVRTVITLAQELEVGLVAEGVESEAVAERLMALGCETGQGFLFDQALDADAVQQRLLAMLPSSRIAPDGPTVAA